MPVAEELAALRALGTVKLTSNAISSKESSNYVFTTPQQQELQRKQKAKQDKAAREEAEKYLRKHNAGGINDMWYQKLRALKARKKAGARSAWRGKEKNDDESEGEDKEEEEAIGLEVEMLPEDLVSALKAKYETENAEEALDKALKEEEEGKGTILSEVMANLDAAEQDNSRDALDDEQLENEEDAVISDEVPVIDTIHEENFQTMNDQPEDELDECQTNLSTEETFEQLLPTDDEPIEEVRTKIERLSIDDNGDEEMVKGVNADSISKEDSSTPTETKEQTKLFYNINTKQFFTSVDSIDASNDLIDLLDPNERNKLDERQSAHVKTQLLSLQSNITCLLEDY